MTANYALPLRYLIAVDDQLAGRSGEIIEVGYEGPKPAYGLAIRYGNLYDQTGTNNYRPYLRASDTASQYDEKVVNPNGVGWPRLLTDQCAAALAAGFECIEWDNPDGYSQQAVLDAVNFAAARGLEVVAKNPLICEWDAHPYVAHPAIVGIIVEEDDAATPAAYDELRKECGKPDLPVWFVAFKDVGEDGKPWITQVAKDAVNYSNIWCSYSPDGEYTSSVDLSMPVKPPVMPPVVETPPIELPPVEVVSNFDRCCDLLLVHEGGNDDDPRDPGGRTSRGILQSEYDRWRQDHPGLPSDVWKAPQQTVLDIYEAKYWNVMRCDDLPVGIDYCVFDYGVNSGVSRGIKLLQTTLGRPVDGVIGPVTIAAAKAVTNVSAFIDRYQDARLAFLKGLSTWSVFGRGWATRVSDVRSDAKKMIGAPIPLPPNPVVPLHDIMWVQQSLNKLGASPPLVEDGKNGPKTKTEIMEFQSTHGLTADGKAGPLTQAEITQALNAAPPTGPILPGSTDPASLLSRVIAGMEAKGYKIDKGAGEINIAYAEGHDRDGKRNNNQPGYWNDVRIVWTYEDNAPKLLGAWTATTQPGPYYTERPLNSGGAANIFPGQYSAWKVALHRGSYEALCQRGTLTLTRDKNKDYSRVGDKVEIGDYEGINQHHGADASSVGPHSAGCIVGKMVDGHQQFMSICKSDPRYKKDRNYMFTSAILAQGEVPL